MSAQPSPSAPAPRGWLAPAIVGVLLATLAAAAWVQWRQYQLLNLTVQYQDDHLMANLNQLESEYLRLAARWHDAVHEPVPDRAALQLRYDIFVSRVALFDSGHAARIISDRRGLDATVRQLQTFMARADVYLGERPIAPLDGAALRALLPELDALNTPIHVLSLDAMHHVSAEVARRQLAVRQHNQAGIALAALLSVTTLVFALTTMRQMRQLNERRRVLEQLAHHLREARADAEAASQAKSVFLANMSHEIRTPFQGVLGMLSLLRETGLDARQLDLLRTATESADHLLVILNDILDMSKLESGTLRLMPEAVQPTRLVGDVEALMRPQAVAKGLALQVVLDGGLPERVLADPTRVKQVLFNMTHNAIKFSDAGTVSLRLQRAGNRLLFSVSDTGIGMDAHTLSRLFQRFTQGDDTRSRRHGGTGLGLEISRNLARLMGGDVRADSAPGVGSRFVFELPLVEAEAALPGDAAPPAGGNAERPLSLLVAEDHAVNRKYLAALLDKLGHRATFVGNGEEAVRAAAEQGPFDLVLMDLHMPVLDGVGAATAIRALPGPIAAAPIVMLTADAFPDTRERCLAAGMDDFLTKPVGLAALQAVLQRRAGHLSPSPATDPPAPAGVLDQAVLDGVLSVMSRDRLTALIGGFLDDSAGLADALREAVRQADDEGLRRMAHAHKGAALNLGLRSLADAAQALQRSPSDGLLAEGRLVLVAAFESRLAETRAALAQQGLLGS